MRGIDPQWVMVIITAIYVVATIAISVFNAKSSKVAREQLEIMQKQFSEESRPRVEVEIHFENRAFFVLRFINHGRHTAYKTRIQISRDFIESLHENYRTLIKNEEGRECIIGVGQYYDLVIGGTELRTLQNLKIVSGRVSYEWNGNRYDEDFEVDVAHQMSFYSVEANM